MRVQPKTKLAGGNDNYLSRLEKQHPYQTMLGVAILGIYLLFGILVVSVGLSVVKQSVAQHVGLPIAFMFSTLFISLSFWFIRRLDSLYDGDQILTMKHNLFMAVAAGFMFLITQVLAWYGFIQQGLTLKASLQSASLYMLPGLHFAHALAGWVLLAVLACKVTYTSKDPVRSLIYLTDPYQKMKLGLIMTYWKHMDFLWLLIFGYFSLMFFLIS